MLIAVLFWMVFGPILVIAACVAWLWLLSLMLKGVLSQ